MKTLTLPLVLESQIKNNKDVVSLVSYFDIPRKILTAKHRRAKYFKFGTKIPNKYKDCSFKNGILVDDSGKPIVANPIAQGTPSYFVINAQSLWDGSLNRFARAKMKKALHNYFSSIELPQLGDGLYEMKYFLVTGQTEFDLINKAFIYQKAFEDTLVGKHSTKFIKDDAVEFIPSFQWNYIYDKTMDKDYADLHVLILKTEPSCWTMDGRH